MDIESVFISPIRSIKSGKQFILRCHIDSPKSMINKKKLMIYDEDENLIDSSALNNTKNFIAILHINGLKFSSKNFQVYIDVKEIMVLNEKKELKLNIIKEKKTIKKQDITDEDSNDSNDNININETIKKDVDNTNTINNEESIQNKSIIEEEKTTSDVNDVINTTDEDKKIKADTDENITVVIENKNDTIEDVKHDFDKLVNDIELNNIEETEKDNLIEENKNDIKEFNIMDTLEESSSISINDPTNEQYEIYKKAVEEARFARQKAMEAYMNAKNIKAQYLFNLEIDSESDEDDLEITVN